MGPFDGVHAFVMASALGIDVPLARFGAAGVDCEDDSLGAEFEAEFADKLRTMDRGRVDANFVGAGEDDFARVGHAADAPSDGERDEDLAGSSGDQIGHDFSRIARSRDVEKDQFVRALHVIAFGEFDWIAGIAQFEKIDAFNDASAGHVETGNDPFGEHQICRKLFITWRPTGPDFSG